MLNRRKRVYAYITNRGRLLIFTHRDFPEAGIQVPGGGVKSGESPEAAVMREAREETGLTGLKFASCLGKLERDMTEFGVAEMQEAFFYHLRYPGNPPAKWHHDETSGGMTDPIRFDFFWATLDGDLPKLRALNGAMIDALMESMKSDIHHLTEKSR